MMDINNVTLEIWKGDWGLPTVDTNCLFVLAYAKFNNICLPVKETCSLWKTPRGQLPVLRSNSSIEDSPHKIIECLDKYISMPLAMSAKQIADLSAYEALLKDKLYPALQYVWWLEEKNVGEFTRPWYFKAISFPVNMYYTRKFEQHARDLIECLHPNEDDNRDLETQIYKDAQTCISLLSARLGSSHYFVGPNPMKLDAVVYAYLAPLLRAPLQNTALQNHLKACTNLTRFLSRITTRHFAAEHKAYEQIKAEETNQNLNAEKSKLQNQILAAAFATCTMLGYGFSNGILKVPGRRSKNLDELDDYTEEAYEIDYDDFYG